MVLYNGATYRYVYSLQGDILGLQNGTGAFVVEYRYDAWGRQTSKTGSLAASLGALNPFRYRGYVYDEETGLYYLRSRYYNPDWGRFISSDSILGRVGGLLQHNLFAYCWNSPINLVDQDGSWPGKYHYQVQRDIIERYPDLVGEVPITRLTGSAGRVDLYCPLTGECWEIKPAKYYALGMDQLMDYIYGTWDEKYGNERKIRGGYIAGNTFMFEGKMVSYSYAGYGVIIYSVSEPKNVLVYVPERTYAKKKSKIRNPLSFPVPNVQPEAAMVGVVAIAFALVAMRGGGGVPYYIREMG